MHPFSPLTASWIWHRQDSYTPYHQVILARKSFRLAGPVPGTLKIAVDGGYRLYVNGEWVTDGPARGWPEHFYYDEIDVSAYLRAGRNELSVTARHWQAGDFHTRAQQAGLLVQLDLDGAGRKGRRGRRIGSDESWETAWLPAWAGKTPKVSIQMEPQELYDARLEDGLSFTPAAVLYAADDGPWRDLRPRDVALLTRTPRHFKRTLGASLLRRKTDLDFCLPVVRLASAAGAPVEANRFQAAAGGMAALVELEAPAELRLELEGMVASIDGETAEEGGWRLEAGRHVLLAFAWPIFNHMKERSLRIVDPPAGLRLANPLDERQANPWVYLALPQYAVSEDDMAWDWFSGPGGRREAAAAGYEDTIQRLLAGARTPAELKARAAQSGPDADFVARQMPAEAMFVQATHWLFSGREVLGSAAGWVDQPAALMGDNAALTTVRPSPDGDIELAYDLGEQSVGYFEFELVAPAGVALDLYAVEYITADGVVQHTGDNHNGLRYITRAGRNRFTSLKRRAGRYLFLALRNQSAPVQIRLLRAIESTYPVEYRSSFACSDANLGRVWDISARTLALCMEDTFTDCPLYEQTFWVGDARNEAIFAYDTFGATDIARRCLRLAAQSLERYPLVGGQVPSSWDTLLPAWSFLWGIAVWDYYFYTGDRATLAELWPAAVANLEGAAARLDANGLFSGKYWNMFDWTPVDDQHETVLHNSLLLVGALDAAQKAAGVLGDTARLAWLSGLRSQLTAAINRWWDPAKKAYPDSIHADGAASASTCMHTSFLALLYDVIPPEHAAAALANMLTPPEGMVRVGSPFAVMYFYETLAKAGRPGEILTSMVDNYLPMLADGATTVWEVFPTSGDRPGGFPTRSHCHAWSSAPLHFLPQVVLGIRQEAPGGTAYTLSPWLGELEWARGTVCTARGPLVVSWRRSRARVEISVRAPEGVEVKFESNPSFEGLEIHY